MGIKEDLKRFKEIGEENREDLSEYIKHGQLGGEDTVKVPIKVVNLPQFEYDKFDMGGVAAGEGDVGDPVEVPDGEAGDGEGDSDEPGDGEGEHGYYEMEPEEFAEELDDELGLDLDPKGKAVKEEVEGAMVDLARSGPSATLDFERMFKKGLKRKMAFHFDEDYLREVLKVEGVGPQKAFEWARNHNIPVSKGWLSNEYQNISDSEKQEHESVESIEQTRDQTLNARDIKHVPIREEDERYKYPKIKKEYEKNAVVVFIRDVSGSMGERKRELVERVFTPMDWYLRGKYDHAEFIYIAHDYSAWEVERDDFFGIQSGGGTQISSAYELTKQILEEDYNWSEWNRYVFAAGDGENSRDDSNENVIPLMKDIPANLHGYLEVNTPGGWRNGSHKEAVDNEFDEDSNVATAFVREEKDVTRAISEILSQEDNE